MKAIPTQLAPFRFFYFGCFLLSLLILLSGCQVQTLSPTATDLPPSPSPLPTATFPPPPPTPTPSPDKVILVVPPDVSPDFAQEAADRIHRLATGSGLVFESQTSLSSETPVQGVRLVVVLSADNNLAQVAQSNPQVHFVAVNPTAPLSPADNLSIIQSDIQQQAFIAGYLTTLIAFDWRAAGIFTDQEADSEIKQAAFANGGAYLCGRCAPIYSPIVLFPLITVIPAPAESGSWQAAVDNLLPNYPYVIYLSPDAAQPELMRYLSERDLILVGQDTPPEEFLSSWAASVTLDTLAPLEDHWDTLLSGQGGEVIPAEIVIKDINSNFLSPGRLALVNQTIQELQAGMIGPESQQYP